MTDTYELTLLRDEELRLLRRIEGLIAEIGQLRGALKLFADEADRTGVEFVKHAQKWKRETIHLSSPTQKYIHPSYARIIGLGLSVVPLILDDLRKQGGDWFYALRAITGENPIKTSMAGDMPKMTRAWLLWGAKRNTQNASQEPKP